MPINELPGVYYVEKVNYELTGEGSKIPIFIGQTNNTETNNYKVDGSVVLQFRNSGDVFRTVVGSDVVDPSTQQVTATWKESTGIGASTTTPLGKVINEFFEEARLLQSSDVGVPYIYVIDVGKGNDYTSWIKAMDNAKALYDATVEVYVGLDQCTTKPKSGGASGNEACTITDLVEQVTDKIHTVSKDLNLRYAFFTKMDADDDALKTLATNCRTKYATSNIQKLSRVGLAVPELFGKSVARICCTPNNIEPGYYVYRSVKENTFKKRTAEKALELQNAGIIFNRDEYINGKIYPKLNLCVSLAFGSSPRPADSLFHARFNADDLLREVFEACYSQIKANESSTNIAYLQTRINKIVNDRVSSEDMIKYNVKTGEGTYLRVIPSDSDPYSLIVTGQIQPQKCTIAIQVQATVKI